MPETESAELIDTMKGKSNPRALNRRNSRVELKWGLQGQLREE